MGIPDFQTCMRPVLDVARDGQIRTRSDFREAVADILGVSEEDREVWLPSGSVRTYDSRVGWAVTYLHQAKLLERVVRGQYRITERGRKVLDGDPDRMDTAFLMQFDEFAEFQSSNSPDETDAASADEEKLERHEQELAEPFATIFRSREEAEWAFDLMRSTCDYLGVDNGTHPGLSVTLYIKHGQRRAMCLNYYGWRMLAFRDGRDGLLEVDFALEIDKAQAELDATRYDYRFERDTRPDIAIFTFVFAEWSGPGDRALAIDPIQLCQQGTLNTAKKEFDGWRNSPFLRHHYESLGEAIFDPAKRDFVLTEGVALTDEDRKLAEPFATIFRSWDEASKSLDLIRATADSLGISGPDDPRLCITQRDYYGGQALFLNFGQWRVLGFSHSQGKRQVHLALLTNELREILPEAEPFFANDGTWPDVSSYRVDELWHQYETELVEILRRTMGVARERFGNWKAAIWQRQHRHDIALALYDKKVREVLLRRGLESSPAVDGNLAPPYDGLFADLDEANWFLDLARDLLFGIGMQDGVTEGVSLTLPGRGKELKVLLGERSVLEVGGSRRMTALLRQEDAQELPSVSSHREMSDYAGGEAGMMQCTFARDDVERAALESALANSIDSHRLYAGSWPRSPHRNSHRPELERAIYDDEYRLALLTGEMVEDTNVVEETVTNPPHPLATIAAETAFPEADLASWVAAIERKGQAILYGPPGTGKTFVAQHLARHLIGGSDGFTRLIQFHPAYAYEDFIEGIRPQPRDQGLHYPVVPGVFRRFCAEAAKCEGICVLIIDEINRANLARVFGELMYLLEYREDSVELAVSGDSFAIPRNVRILGTMNTADRSIALVDHALRRRFAFIALQPQYAVLRAHAQEGVNTEALIETLVRINARIGDPNYAVGISFFLVDDLADNLESIWQMEIEPYLDEYFWGQSDQVDDFCWTRIAPKVLGG